MTGETQVLIALILWLSFFGWIGVRRGYLAELWLLGVTVISWVLLQEQGDIVVRLTNFAGKFVALVRAGGLTADAEEAVRIVAEAPNVITEDNRQGFLFLVWAIIVLTTFVATSNLRFVKPKTNSKLLSFLVGAVNGLIFAALLLPVLNELLQAAPLPQDSAWGGLFVVISRIWTLLVDNVSDFWSWMLTWPAGVWLLLITALLLLIAWPLRGSAAGKK
ncbi:hypothetical protein [Caldilinea sp.]|jgi:hypothetical protein|uniref:hypothetical protein n=1 Tax=Caldilinea sp. TaxID=2293560 RepID=UPI0021DF134E|nr:hypothetical protein [Caldilinea sp.]GIV68625.1 MAG: hypothetical protein KatS3mg048_1487 [Caldilinea sp.]